MNWYPDNKNELNKLISSYLKEKPKVNNPVHGIIVPHAGYEYSGAIAGAAYSILPKKTKAIILGPSHHVSFRGIRRLHSDRLKTPLGKIKMLKNNYKDLHVPEHSVINQIPFLQRLGYNEILPLIVGNISKEEAKELAEELSNEKDCVFIISTDLSHFEEYFNAKEIDKKTIKSIIELDEDKLDSDSVCGYFPLLILFELCKIKNYKPNLIIQKNSGDVTGDKSRVVGYASFYF